MKSAPHRLYRKIRPILQDWGVLTFAQAVIPRPLRRSLARGMGLGGFDVSQAVGNRLPDWAPLSDNWCMLPSQQTGINLIGDLRSNIGLSQQTRLLHEAIKAANIPTAYAELLYEDATQSAFDPADLPIGAPYAVNLACINFKDYYAQVCKAPPEFFRDKYTIAYWTWELESLPPISPANFHLMHEIWTCSQFSADSIAAATEKPVTVVPQPIIAAADENARRADFGLPENRYIVLFIFDPNSSIARKNPFAAIEAFRAAFGVPRGDDAPLLVIKTHRSESVADEKYAARLQYEIRSVNGVLMDAYLPQKQMTNLIALCDCYLSLHRSEGFGLTIAEAMALGKPVIATGYSGNMDYMTAENSCPVDFTLREITPQDHDYQPRFRQHYPPGHRWAEPSIDHAAELLNNVRRFASQIKQNAAATIATRYHPVTIGSRILEHLHQICYDRA